jgi:hypothetical protein
MGRIRGPSSIALADPAAANAEIKRKPVARRPLAVPFRQLDNLGSFCLLRTFIRVGFTWLGGRAPDFFGILVD